MSKPIVYAEIPEFNQATQVIYQAEPVDMGDYIYIGVEVRDLPYQEDIEPEYIPPDPPTEEEIAAAEALERRKLEVQRLINAGTYELPNELKVLDGTSADIFGAFTDFCINVVPLLGGN